MSIDKVLDVFFTTPHKLTSLLREMDKDVLIECFVNILHEYATDVNSSTLRELFTLYKAGYRHIPGKLGYNGKAPDGRVCDVKPINIRSGKANKLNGGGNFTDFTYERLDRYLKDGVIMLVSGFVDGRLVYILEFPLLYLQGQIRRQLDKFFRVPRQPGQYLRSASFSFKHYKWCPELKLIFRSPDLAKFMPFLTKDLYVFLRREGWK